MLIHYEAPGYEKDAFNCLHCGAYSHQDWSKLFVIVSFQEFGSKHTPMMNEEKESRLGSGYQHQAMLKMPD